MYFLSRQRCESYHEQQGQQERLCSFACKNQDLMSVHLLWDGILCLAQKAAGWDQSILHVQYIGHLCVTFYI